VCIYIYIERERGGGGEGEVRQVGIDHLNVEAKKLIWTSNYYFGW
jgi:hypothetical protein